MAAAWTAQLCGLCLALRDDYGQTARIATNYDGLVVSLLVEAQSVGRPARRTAGRCPLRGMRRADVAAGDCVRLAAVVSLALAAARVRDHVDDRDGVVGVAGVRPAARRIAERWVRQGTDTGHTLGYAQAGFSAQSGTPRGQQEPINFGDQPEQLGPEGETPAPGRKKRGGDTGWWCCCDGCDCCCDCDDCCCDCS